MFIQYQFIWRSNSFSDAFLPEIQKINSLFLQWVFNVRWFFRDMANLRITFDALRASLNKVFATFLLHRDKMPEKENKVRIV